MERTKMFEIELPTISIFFYQNIFNFVAQLFQKMGAGGGNPRRPPPPQPPKNFERSILLAGQFPTRISKNFDSSYYNARDIAIFKTSTIKKKFFQKMIDLKMPSFRSHPRELKG